MDSPADRSGTNTMESIASPSKRRELALVVFCVVTLTVVSWFIFGVHGLGPLDDHHMMQTLFEGKPFGFYISPELGRFFPLTAQEYVVASKLLHPAPFIFYSMNAAKIWICAALLFQCLALTGLGLVARAIFWSIIIFSVGMANTLYRLSAGELDLLVLMLCLTWALVYLSDDHRGTQRRRRTVSIVVFVLYVAALFYKEIAFIFGLVFGASECLRRWRGGLGRPSGLVAALIAISVAYIAFYAIWRMTGVSQSYAGFHSIPLADLIVLFAQSDPFILLVALPVTIYRWSLVIHDPKLHVVYDSMLLAALAYTAAIFALDIFSPYYLLPTYAFAVVGVAGTVGASVRRPLRAAAIALTGLCCINVLPVYASDVRTQKLVANNHYRFVQEFAHWLIDNHTTDGSPRKVVLAGASAGNDIEIIQSLGIFLEGFGVSPKSIEIVGSQASDNPVVSAFYKASSQAGYQVHAGDVLVFNPYQSMGLRPFAQSLPYRPLFRSDQQWTPPRWMAINWIALCIPFANCEPFVDGAKRYAGYTAFLAKREPRDIPLDPLSAPMYSIKPFAFPEHPAKASVVQTEVSIENTGTEPWPANGRLQAGRYVNLAYRWFDADGKMALVGDRTALPEPVFPEDEVTLPIAIKTPPEAGRYRLVVGPLQEDVRWFDNVPGRWIDVQ